MRATSRVIVATLLLVVAGGAATLQRYPYLQNVRPDRATIMWTTTESGVGWAEYSPDTSFSRTSALVFPREFQPSQTGQVFPYYQYEVEMTGLAPGTRYFYRVVVDNEVLASGEDYFVRTPGTGPFRFLAFGDSGFGSPGQRDVAALMIAESGVSLAIHTGDIAYPRGTFFEFQSFYFFPYQNMMRRIPIFPSLGNHEYYTPGAVPAIAGHSVPKEDIPPPAQGRYYSFDWSNVHFVALDSNDPLVKAVQGTGAMLDWLENDLRKTRKFWRIVYFHHPPYAAGPNENDPLSVMVRERVVPILERYAVPLVFNGHEHSYQRSKYVRGGTFSTAPPGTLYITTGGGGGPLYPVYPREMVAFGETVYHFMRAEVEGTRITLRAIRANGSEIENVTLAPQPTISAGGTVNAASFTTGIAPGGLISVFGVHLAAQEAVATSFPLPTELSGAFLVLNGRRLPLLYVSGTQINAQLPFDAGSGTLTVTSPNGSFSTSVNISAAAPAIFTTATEAGSLPTVLHGNGQLVTTSSPAQAGEALSIYLTGLGQVEGTVFAAGQPAPSSPPLRARMAVQVQFGSSTVTPSFAGLAPSFAGLYQVNVQVPADVPTGTHTLRVSAGGIVSNAVSLTVKN